MIPLILFCVVGGCLDQPVDNRPLWRQVQQDQFTPAPIVSCYHGDKYYEDCSDANPFGFNLEEDDEHSGSRWNPRARD